tara:strand:+ start:2534 stop:3256 length:723 start_codon:yes stop_codon:yes gene_type:complete
MNNVYAIIPARSGSKGVKDKNIKDLCGHSLLEWAIASAKKSILISEIIISTDSNLYADIARNNGIDVPFLRPDSISGDNASDIEFVIHVIKELEKLNKRPDFLVQLRPTTPLRDPAIIDDAIDSFIKNDEYTSLRSVHKMSESSYKTLEINNNCLTPLSIFGDNPPDVNAPRQNFPETYQPNGYIDILCVKNILNTKNIHGNKIFPYITDVAYEIDSIEDFDFLEYSAAKSIHIIDKLFN